MTRWVWLLVGYLALLLIAFLEPTGQLAARAVHWTAMHVPDFVPDQLVFRTEFILNVLILVPLSFLAAMVWRRVKWQEWTAYVFIFTFGVEMVQSLRPGRSAAYSDVVANTLGGVIGAVLGAVVLRDARSRHDLA